VLGKFVLGDGTREGSMKFSGEMPESDGGMAWPGIAFPGKGLVGGRFPLGFRLGSGVKLGCSGT
jgi:hypothetical protein